MVLGNSRKGITWELIEHSQMANPCTGQQGKEDKNQDDLFAPGERKHPLIIEYDSHHASIRRGK